MESLYESMVMYYLTHSGSVFVCPQFPLEGGTTATKYPDFVAFDFGKNVAQIVEVSVAANTKELQLRVRWHTTEGARRLRRKLVDMGLSDRLPSIEVLVFAREEAKLPMESLHSSEVNVRHKPIEVAFKRWKWALEKIED